MLPVMGRVLEYDCNDPARPLTVTPSRSVTNFFVMYKDNVLPNQRNGVYGHGRERYDAIEEILDANAGSIDREIAWQALQAASQAPNPQDVTSNTQWSILYDNHRPDRRNRHPPRLEHQNQLRPGKQCCRNGCRLIPPLFFAKSAKRIALLNQQGYNKTAYEKNSGVLYCPFQMEENSNAQSLDPAVPTAILARRCVHGLTAKNTS